VNRAARPCPTPGCQNLTTTAKGCASCRARSEHRALYDADWDTFARWWLSRHRICQACRQRQSAEVHHKVSVRIAPHRRLDPTNVIALCHPCHHAVTPTVRADAGSKRRRR
jgi:5-methylcytosine-specific restriction protein A